MSRRDFAGGCYDPIVRTPTLGGRCLDQVHCQELNNTMCALGECLCQPGFRASPRNSSTGLIPGCDPDPNSMTSADGTVDECRDVFALETASVSHWEIQPFFR